MKNYFLNPKQIVIYTFLIITNLNAQYTIDQSVEDIPYYQHNALAFQKIDSLKQDSNFVMTGFYKEPERAFKIWGPRLYPHGDFEVAASAYAEYYQDFNSNTSSVSGCSEYEVNWNYVGSNGLPDFPDVQSAAGQINVLQFDPNYNNITNKTIYGGSFYGGLWRTLDNGVNWNQVNTDSQIPISSVSDIAISHSNTNILFISTGSAGIDGYFSSNTSGVNAIYSAGVYRSTDYGENWEPINTGLTNLMTSSTSNSLTIKRMEINPTNSNQIFICTNKGLYRCNNALSVNPLWIKVGTSASGSTINENDSRLFGVDFKPNNTNTVYASGEDIIRSSDGGNVWHSITGPSYNLDFGSINQYLTYNDSNSFIKLLSVETIDAINIDVNDAEPDVLYAHIVCHGSVNKKTSSYDLVTHITTFTDTNYTQKFSLIYRFSNENWEKMAIISNGIIGSNGNWMAIESDPINLRTVYVSGINVYRVSPNSDSTYTHTKVSTLVENGYHFDTHDLEFPPVSNPDYLYSANHGGVAKELRTSLLTGDGHPWISISNGIQTQLIWSFDENRFDPSKKVIGLQDASTVISCPDSLNNLYWHQTGSVNDGYGIQISNDTNTTIISRFSGADGYFTRIKYNNNGSVTSLGGSRDRHYFPKNQEYEDNYDLPLGSFPVINHPKTDKPILATHELFIMNKVFPGYFDKWDNSSSNLWTTISDVSKDPNDSREISNVVFAPNNLDDIYITTHSHLVYHGTPGSNSLGGGLYKSTTGFRSEYGSPTDIKFNSILENIINSYQSSSYLSSITPPITGITVDPDNSDRVWISFSGFETAFKVLYSEDGGDTWDTADPEESLHNLPVNEIHYQDGSNDRLFIATDAGVYFKDATMTCWEKYGDLPNVRVMEIKISPCTGRMTAATFGRGIWEVDLPKTGSITNDVIIEANTVWTGDKYHYGNLVIPNGVTLTIQGKVHMPFNSIIKVEKGGHLIVDGGTLTNNCGAPWKGIHVYGDDNLSQNPETNQGYVELINAQIEFAVNGVSLIGRDLNDNISWGTAGGVLKAENTKFYNCRRGIEYMSYSHLNADYNSYVKNCTFEFDDDFETLFGNEHYGENYHPVGISMWDVKGVKILGCDFINNMTQTNEIHNKYNGHGIITFDASPDITPLYNNWVSPLQVISRNTFTGFDLGVYSAHASGANSMLIQDNVFSDNKLGVYLDGGSNTEIVQNQFTVPHLESDAEGYDVRAAGVFMVQPIDCKIEENNFIGTNDGNNFDGGLAIEDIYYSDNIDMLYNNNFDDLAYGFLSYGDNGGLIQGQGGLSNSTWGIELRCNDFGQTTNNYQDWYINEYSAIKPWQGTANNRVGNRFSDAPLSGIYGHIKHGVGALDIDYYYSYSDQTTQPDKSDVGKVNIFPNELTFNKLEKCPSNYNNDLLDENGISLDDLLNDFTQISLLDGHIKLLENNFSVILNGGIGPELLDALLDGNETSQEVRDLLISESPYLSDEILIAAINRSIPMSQWHLTEILIWNSRLSRNVLNALYQSQPLTPYQYNLVVNADQGSQRYLLEMDLDAKRVKLENLKSNYLTRARRCSDANIYNEMIKIYDMKDDVFSTAQCIDIELKQKNFIQASTRLENYMVNNSSHHLFNDYYSLAIDLQESGRNWFQMNTNESRIMNTLEISADRLIAKKAQVIKRLINDNPAEMNNLPINTSAVAAKQTYIGKPSDEVLQNMMEVEYFSDSKSLVFVCTDNVVTYNIVNSLGQLVVQGKITNTVETKDVSYLKRGSYYIQMFTEQNTNSCYEKFIIH